MGQLAHVVQLCLTTQASVGGGSPHVESSEHPSEEQENMPVEGEEPQAPVGTKGIKKAVRKTRGKGRRSDASFVYIADVFLFCNLKGLP